MKKITDIYKSAGRWGIVILLAVLIISALLNRIYMGVIHREAGYIAELIFFILILVLSVKYFKKTIISTSREKIFRYVLLAGIIFRLVFMIHDFINRPVQESDYIKHEKLGARIAFEGEFYDFAGVELRNFRQPGLPAVFAIGLLMCNSPVVYSVVMILFSFGVLIAGFRLFKEFRNPGSVISFSYIALSPNMLFMASTSNTQLPFFFFLLLLFIVLINYSGKFYQIILIGFLIAGEMYVRFNFLFLLILIPFFIEKHSAENIKVALMKTGYVYLFFLIFYSPWIYRNYNIYGKIRLMPSEGPRFYSSNVIEDYTKAGGYNGVSDSVINKYKNLSEEEFDKALRNEAIDFVKNNPGKYVKGIPFRVMKYSGRQDWTIGYFFDNTGYKEAKIFNEIFQGIENIFFWIILIYPFLFFLKNKHIEALPAFILWGYMLYSIILLSVSETRSRYNFPYILFPVFASGLIKTENSSGDEKNSNGKYDLKII